MNSSLQYNVAYGQNALSCDPLNKSLYVSTFTAPPTAFEVRLDSESSDRYLEVFYNSTWNRICYSSAWTQEEATVVCRQLGLPDEGAVVFPNTVSFDWSNEAIIALDGIQCIGNEESLDQCLPVGLDIHTYCRKSYDEVGVVCTNGKKLLNFQIYKKDDNRAWWMVAKRYLFMWLACWDNVERAAKYY